MGRSVLKHTVLLVVLATFIVSCGGGGGGSVAGDSGPAYSGLTSQALITEDNAQELSTTALTTGIVGSSPASVARSVENEERASAIQPTSILLLTSIMRTVEKSLPETTPTNDVSRAVVNATDTIYGTCGGRADYSIEVNDVTGVFSGEFDFGNFCEAEEIVNGEVEVSGEIDLDTGDFIYLVMDFYNLQSDSGFESITMSGSIDMEIRYDSVDFLMNSVVRDNISGKTFMVEDFSVYIEEYVNQIYMEMSGRFYHPDYGYVVLSTPSIIQMDFSSGTPGSGQLLLTGRDSTSARLIIHDSESCEVEADLDGNGSYESTTGPILWSSL